MSYIPITVYANALNAPSITDAANLMTLSGAQYNKPIQRFMLRSDVTGTLTIPNNGNHRNIQLDMGSFNIQGSGSTPIVWDNSLGPVSYTHLTLPTIYSV